MALNLLSARLALLVPLFSATPKNVLVLVLYFSAVALFLVRLEFLVPKLFLFRK